MPSLKACIKFKLEIVFLTFKIRTLLCFNRNYNRLQQTVSLVLFISVTSDFYYVFASLNRIFFFWLSEFFKELHGTVSTVKHHNSLPMILLLSYKTSRYRMLSEFFSGNISPMRGYVLIPS